MKLDDPLPPNVRAVLELADITNPTHAQVQSAREVTHALRCLALAEHRELKTLGHRAQ